MVNNNDKKVLNVPDLRFPEFSGEWKHVHLKEIAEFQKQRISTALLNNNNYISTENILQDFEGIQCSSSMPANVNVIKYQNEDILLSNIRPYLKKVWFADRKGGCSADVLVLRGNKCDKYFLYYGMIERSDINIDIKFEQESISGYKIVRKGDYVVHLRSFQGGFAFSDRTGICSPAYIILRPNDLVVYSYLSHYFTSKPFIKSLKLVTYGIRDGRSINVDEWLDMPILLPPAQEQIRILTIVNAIDAKLTMKSKYNFAYPVKSLIC